MRDEDRPPDEAEPILYERPSPLAQWHHAILWGIFVLALLVRAAYLKQLLGSPLWAEMPGDGGTYRDWASEIATGAWRSSGAFERGPLYAWLLAGIFRLFGQDLMGPRLVQTVIGAGICVLVYRLGRQAFSPATGLAAGLAASLFGPWLHRDAAIAPDIVAGFLMAACLDQIFTANASQRGLLGTSGLCLGLGALARESIVWAAPPIALWLVLDPWIRGGRSAGRLRESGGRLVAFGAGLLLVVLPVAARNLHASGQLVLLTTGSGPALDQAAGYARYRDAIPLLALTDPLWRLLWPAAAAGLALSLTRWRETLGFYLLIASYGLSVTLGIPGAPASLMVLVEILLAGAAIAGFVSAAATRRWLRLALAAAVFLGALLLAGITR